MSQRHDPEVQEKLKKIDVVLRWLILGGHLILGNSRYALDKDGSLIFQYVSSDPEESSWFAIESMSVNYFFKKCIELTDDKILEIRSNLALNSSQVKKRNLKGDAS